MASGKALSWGAIGRLGEAVAAAFLAQYRGLMVERLTQTEQLNFAIDMVAGDRAVEAKASLVSAPPDGMKWRATIGQPGHAETALLREMTRDQRMAHNAKKYDALMARKASAVETVSLRLHRALRPTMIGVLLDTDRRVADVYEFDGFHRILRWTHPTVMAKKVGSYAYDQVIGQPVLNAIAAIRERLSLACTQVNCPDAGGASDKGGKGGKARQLKPPNRERMGKDPWSGGGGLPQSFYDKYAADAKADLVGLLRDARGGNPNAYWTVKHYEQITGERTGVDDPYVPTPDPARSGYDPMKADPHEGCPRDADFVTAGMKAVLAKPPATQRDGYKTVMSQMRSAGLLAKDVKLRELSDKDWNKMMAPAFYDGAQNEIVMGGLKQSYDRTDASEVDESAYVFQVKTLAHELGHASSIVPRTFEGRSGSPAFDRAVFVEEGLVDFHAVRIAGALVGGAHATTAPTMNWARQSERQVFENLGKWVKTTEFTKALGMKADKREAFLTELAQGALSQMLTKKGMAAKDVEKTVLRLGAKALLMFTPRQYASMHRASSLNGDGLRRDAERLQWR